MFLEEFALDAAGVFEPPPLNRDPAPDLPIPGTLLGAGGGLFLACDLFPALHVRKRARAHRQPLNVLPGQAPARYCGDVLDQFDMDVFLGCAVKELSRGRPGRHVMRQFLSGIGRKATPSYVARLEASLFRLASARIELDDSRFGCCLQLLESVLVDRGLGVCRVKVSAEALAALRRVEGVEALAALRFGLGPRPLTKWLAGFLCSLGSEAALLDLERLRLLCGRSATDPAVFAGQALPALRTLADMGYIASFRQRPDGRVVVLRHPGRRGPGQCQIVR